MPPPDDVARFARQAGLPADRDGPVFTEPWQAEAFALTVRLHEAGCFTWAEWAAALAAELRMVGASGKVDDGAGYYDGWLAALERLVTTKHVVSVSDLDRRKAAWTEAYLSTPHGQPVELPREHDTA